MRLGARITLLFLLFTTLPWIAAYFIILGRLEDNLEQIARVQIGANITSVTTQLDRQQDRLERVMQRLSGRRYLKEALVLSQEKSPNFDQTGLIRYTVEAASAPELDELLVMDRSGEVLANAANEYDFGARLNARPWFAEAMRLGKDVRLEKSGDGGALLVRITRAVRFRNKVVGVLSGGFLTDESLLKDLAKTTGAHLWISDGVRMLLTDDASQPKPVRFVRTLTPEKNFEKSRYLQRLHFPSGPYLYGAVPLLGSKGYYLVVGTSEKRREDLEQKLQQALLLVVALMGAMGVLAGPWVSFRLLRPVGQLLKGAKALKGGDLDYRVKANRPSPDLRILVEAFNDMAASLKRDQEALVQAERKAAWREIGVRIAHEIKNPLTPIQVTLESLQRAKKRQDPDFDQHLDEGVETMLKEVDRLRRLAKDFADFSRLPSPTPQTVRLSEFMKRLMVLYQAPAGNLKVTLDVQRDAVVEMDPEQIQGVLVNLVNNSLDALRDAPPEEGGEVTIILSRGTVLVGDVPQDMALIMVRDNGPGIDPAILNTVFEPYVSSHRGGTGLGLTIARRTVHDHGGVIEAENLPESGAVFRVYLPLKFKQMAPE